LRQFLAERTQFLPRRDGLGAQHQLRHTPEGTRGGKEFAVRLHVPNYVEDGLVVSWVGVVAVRMPVVGAQMDLDRADDDLRLVGKADGRPDKVGSSAMIPKARLDDLDGAAVVRQERGTVKLFKPKGLDRELGRRGVGGLPQVTRWAIEAAVFHARNLIPPANIG
jgi:hypothetical protein